MSQFLSETKSRDADHLKWEVQYMQHEAEIDGITSLEFVEGPCDYEAFIFTNSKQLFVQLCKMRDTAVETVNFQVENSTDLRLGMIAILLCIERLPNGATLLCHTANKKLSYHVGTNFTNIVSEGRLCPMHPKNKHNGGPKNMDIGIALAIALHQHKIRFAWDPQAQLRYSKSKQETPVIRYDITGTSLAPEKDDSRNPEENKPEAIAPSPEKAQDDTKQKIAEQLLEMPADEEAHDQPAESPQPQAQPQQQPQPQPQQQSEPERVRWTQSQILCSSSSLKEQLQAKLLQDSEPCVGCVIRLKKEGDRERLRAALLAFQIEYWKEIK